MNYETASEREHREYMEGQLERLNANGQMRVSGGAGVTLPELSFVSPTSVPFNDVERQNMAQWVGVTLPEVPLHERVRASKAALCGMAQNVQWSGISDPTTYNDALTVARLENEGLRAENAKQAAVIAELELIAMVPVPATNVAKVESETESDKQPATARDEVQEHVDAIIQDLTNGDVNGKQRGSIGKALQDAAVGGIGRSEPKVWR